MLTVEALWKLIDREVGSLPASRGTLENACGRRLAEPVYADMDMPAFSRSAIDGFAVAAGSLPGEYRLVGEVQPGSAEAPVPAPGEAWRIFTGSAVADEGVELVMVEDTSMDGNRVTLRNSPSRSLIRFRASQARRGQLLLNAGEKIRPGTVALLASVGLTEPLLSPIPRVAHVVTGSELVEAGQIPAPGTIRDSNTPLIAALLAGAGAVRSHHQRVSEDIRSAVAGLAPVDADVYLISGGASVGAYDGTARVLRNLGFNILSEKVKCRPGKPLIFARRGAQIAFGLPGNPLSHFVCFQLFVRRALARLTGLPPAEPVAVTLLDLPPAPDPRETWWPARIHSQNGILGAHLLPWQDSSDLTGLAGANALVKVPSDGITDSVQALILEVDWKS